MKIGIIGSGNMGRAIGVRLSDLGHDLFFGARRREQADDAAALAKKGAKAGPNMQAAAFADIIIWTIRTSDPSEVLADPTILEGKIVIDLNNRDYSEGVRNGGWFETAIAEDLQAALPKAHIVKALNTIAMETFDTTPQKLMEAGAQTFLAGANEDAKRLVADLVGDLGFEAVDLGSGRAAYRAAEALGDVIRLLMIDGGKGGRAHLVLSRLPKPDLSSIGERGPSEYH